jgi:aquaporin Z
LAVITLAVAGSGAGTASLFVMFGLIAVVLAFSGVSGAHLNPALTIGALATRRINLSRAVSYIVAQVVGAVLALVVMSAFVNAAPEVSQQMQAFGQSAASLYEAPKVASGKEWAVLFAELMGTTILAYAVAAGLRAGRSRLEHAFLYGGGFFVAFLAGGTAASYVSASVIMNPAVAYPLQALKWSVWPLVIYVLTPVVGAVLGFALHSLVSKDEAA